MRVFKIVIIFLLSLELCFCDQVDCIKVQNSMRGYYTFCSSTNNFPLKIQSTVVVLNDYIFTSTYSWKYWLRSINGQILKLDDYCMTNNPSNGLRPQFSNITFGLTCYQLPRKVQYGDAIQISFFDDYYFDKLIYLLPITIKAQVQTLQSIEHKHQANEIIQQAVKIQIQPLKTVPYKLSSQ